MGLHHNLFWGDGGWGGDVKCRFFKKIATRINEGGTFKFDHKDFMDWFNE